MKLRKPTMAQMPPIALSLAGVAGISPMAVYRMLEGSYVVATIDALAASCFALIAWTVYVKNWVRGASLCMAFIAIATATVTIHLRGGDQIIWMYPVTIALFYLLRPRDAAVASIVAIAMIMPAVFDGRPPSEIAILMTSLGVTIALSVAFAVMTTAQQRDLHATTLLDPLTGLGNRRAMDATLEDALDAARDSRKPFVLIMWDIDHFKKINDNYGHVVGDIVLKSVADTVTRHLREGDLCFRVGGEEFVVIANVSTLEPARKLAERLRLAIAQAAVEHTDGNPELSVTASFGIAEYLSGDSHDSIYKRADDALYEAKRSGRNRLHLAERTLSLSGTATHAVLPRLQALQKANDRNG